MSYELMEPPMPQGSQHKAVKGMMSVERRQSVASGTPRFIQVTNDSEEKNRRVLVDVKRVEVVLDFGSAGCDLFDEKGNALVSCVEPIETIISRIREVGGVVSSYEPPK